MPSSIHHEETAWHARGIAWYRACGAIVFLYHLLVLLCLLCRSPSTHRRWKRNKPKTKKKNTQTHTQNRGWQSLCAEMASELRFAMRCGSRQRPAAKARNSDAAVPCDRCSPRATRRRTRYCSTGHEETTYIPSIEIPRLNGVSPVPHDGLSTMASLRILPFSSPFSLRLHSHFLLLFQMVCLVSRMVEKNYSFRAAHRAEKVLINISEKFYVSWDIQLLLHVTNDLLLISFIFTVSRKFQEIFKMNSFFFNTLYTYRRYGHRQCRSSPL